MAKTTAQEIVTSDFYDALAEEKLQGLCAVYGEGGWRCSVNCDSIDMALNLAGTMTAKLGLESCGGENALASALIFGAAELVLERTGKSSETFPLTGGEIETLCEVLRQVVKFGELTGAQRKKLAAALK